MPTFTISELADAAGTTPRTVRYYTAEGILPPPDARGRYATYSDEHLDRLRLIDRLKGAHQPLNAIRARMECLTHADIRGLLSGPKGLPGSHSFDDLLLRSAKCIRERELQAVGGDSARSVSRSQDDFRKWSIDADVSVERDDSWNHEADTWQRIMFAPGVELHLRQPVAAASMPAIDELCRLGRKLFEPS